MFSLLLSSAEIVNPDICNSFVEIFEGDFAAWFNLFVEVVGAFLLVAAVLYVSFIGWRAFKAATSKV